jgi:pyocin large subunit-like protein
LFLHSLRLETMMSATRTILLAATAALALSACDNGPSAVAPKQAAGTQMAAAPGEPSYSTAPSRDDDAAPRVDHRDDPVKLVDGKPMWSASRRFSAEQNARRAFERNGEAFGADTLDQFVKKAHAFVESPPKGAQTLKRRNGDLLIYDPKSNVFAVRSKAGAPRTMFRPDEGRAYWDEQVARENRRSSQSARRDREDDA